MYIYLLRVYGVSLLTCPPRNSPVDVRDWTRNGDKMARKERSVEEIISKLREAEVALAQGETLGQACRRIGVSDHTFYRWRGEYGGLKVDQAKRLRDMEGENARLRRAVADLTVDNQILKEAARGNF